MDEQKLEKLQTWVKESSRIVFFGGAGVSTESGIPDFRGEDGLYRQRYAYPPETIISHSFYVRHPEIFFDFYRNRMLYPNAKPNVVHQKLAQWERDGKLLAVVTQNIDGLHQMAGSRNVYELHGSVHRNTCQKCGARYTLAQMLTLGDVPKCPKCGGRVKPDVVLYEEGLDPLTISGALDAIRGFADRRRNVADGVPRRRVPRRIPRQSACAHQQDGHPAGRYRESGAA